MKYSVDFDRKEIAHSDLPPGHLIALKRMYEPKGFLFRDVRDIVHIEHYDPEVDYGKKHQERAFRIRTGPGGHKMMDEAIKKEFERQMKMVKQTGIMFMDTKTKGEIEQLKTNAQLYNGKRMEEHPLMPSECIKRKDHNSGENND